MPTDYADTIARFSGFAAEYDRFRPTPPPTIADLLCAYARTESPDLVVDVGCGTGLSTRLWCGRARRIVGIDASDDMLARARLVASDREIDYCAGTSAAMPLPDACADIVTCSQSLHWMEPAATFAEAARILRPGGVFAAYDCDWPASVGSWRVEAAETDLVARASTLHDARGFAPGLRRWDKEGHAARMRASGRFRYVREIVLHSPERGNADRFVGLVLTQGVVQTVIKHGISEAEIGIPELRRLADEELGPEPRDWWFSYRVRLAVV